MARSWKCAQCSASNDESSLTCGRCGLLRGSVVPAAPPTAGWSSPPAPPVAPGAPPPGTRQGVDAGFPAGPGGAQEGWSSAVAAGSPAAPAKPLWRRVPAGLVIVGLLIAVGAIGAWYTNAGRSSSGEIVKSGDLTINDMRIGDCYDLKDPAAAEFDKVIARPCADEHEYELYYIGTMPEGAYPDETAITSFVDSVCTPAFGAYVGRDYNSSELEYFYFFPNSDAWAGGDRTIQCAVYHPIIHRLTGSLRGSGR